MHNLENEVVHRLCAPEVVQLLALSYRAAAALRYAPASVPTPYVVLSCSTAPWETDTPPIGIESARLKVVGMEVVWGGSRTPVARPQNDATPAECEGRRVAGGRRQSIAQ